MKCINYKLSRLVGVAVICGVSGCVNTTKLQHDVDRLTSSLNDLRNSQAEQISDLSSLKGEVQRVSGRLEELEHSQKVDLGTNLNAVREDLNNLKGRIPPPAIVPIEMLEADERRGAELPAEVADKFMSALQNIKEGKFSIAEGLLEETLDAVYGKPESAMVLYWIGVSAEGLNVNPKAIKNYAEIVARFPKSSRAPAALLRQASVLIRLGDKKAASLTLKKLIGDFPKSSEAGRAKERLKDL